MKLQRYLRGITALLLALILTLAPGAALASDMNHQVLNDLTECKDWPEPPAIASTGAILVNAASGDILYGKNAFEPLWPASITKLMTALLTLENCKLEDTVTFSYRATHDLEAGATSIARTEDEEMTVEDCLYALLLTSANEVAQGLAEHVGGTIEDFADMMNTRAEELGCTNTHFVTPSGLHKDDHVTTCADMARIMRALVQIPEFMEIQANETYVIPPTNKHKEETPLAQKHKLLKKGASHYEGALAGKTGYTVTAGHSLVTYAVREDVELIAVIIQSDATQYNDTKALLDYGFKQFESLSLADTPGAVEFARATLTARKQYPVNALDKTFFSASERLIVPKTVSLSTLTADAEPLTADATEEGVPVAKITFYLEDHPLGTATLMNPGKLPAVLDETQPAEESEVSITDDLKQDLKSQGKAFFAVFWTALVKVTKAILGKIAHLLSPSNLKDLYQRYGLIFPGILLGIVAVIALIVGLSIRSSRNRRKRNRHISPRVTHGRKRRSYRGPKF